MNGWLGRLWFAPNDLQQYARAGRAMQGIYVPYWTYDAETRTDYTGQRGTVYYETRPVTVVVNGRRQTAMQQVARIRWYAGARPGGARLRRRAGAGLDEPAQALHRRAGAVGPVGALAPTSRTSSPASAPRATRCRSRTATARRGAIMNAVIEQRRAPRHRRRPAADRPAADRRRRR